MDNPLLKILENQQIPTEVPIRKKKCEQCQEMKDADYGYYAGTSRKNRDICIDCQKEEGRKLIEDYRKSGHDASKMPPREKDAQETD